MTDERITSIAVSTGIQTSPPFALPVAAEQRSTTNDGLALKLPTEISPTGEKGVGVRIVAAVVVSYVCWVLLGLFIFPSHTVAGAFSKMFAVIAIGVVLLRGAKEGSAASKSWSLEVFFVLFFGGDGALGMYNAYQSQEFWEQKPLQAKNSVFPDQRISKMLLGSEPEAEIPPNDAVFYHNRGTEWLNKRQYEKAIEDLNEAIRLDPKLALAYCSRGIAWSNKQQYEKAIEDLNEAIRLDPKLALAYCSRGTAWSNKHQYEKAIEDLDEAIRLDPKSAYYYSSRGIAWWGKQQYEKAIEDLDEAIRLDPKYALAYTSLASLLTTWPETKVPGAKRAIQLATTACELTDWKDRWALETLAAARAEDAGHAAQPEPPPLKEPDVRLNRKSNLNGDLWGSVHNETGRPIASLKLSIKTAAWQRVYDVKVWVANNTTAKFCVEIGEENLRVESFEVLSFGVLRE